MTISLSTVGPWSGAAPALEIANAPPVMDARNSLRFMGSLLSDPLFLAGRRLGNATPPRRLRRPMFAGLRTVRLWMAGRLNSADRLLVQAPPSVCGNRVFDHYSRQPFGS